MTEGSGMRKVTLNLFRSDVEALEKRYGWGWSEVVRDLVNKHLREKRHEEDKWPAD